MEAPSSAPAVEFAQKTDPGRDPDKQVNEDSAGYRATRFGHLCLVCDGMGGHAGGREASNLALQTVFEFFDAAPAEASPPEVLRGALMEANRRVYAMTKPEVSHGRPGSTAVAVLLNADGTYTAHVGDSRCYMVHHGQIFQVTKDHSMVQELVDRGLLTPAQAAVHPDANMITRALGMSPEAAVDVRTQAVPHVAGDAFVLCSDGLSDLVEANEILKIVGSAPAAQAAGQLVDLANARGGHDNITVQVLRAKESARAEAAQVAPTIALTAPPGGTQAMGAPQAPYAPPAHATPHGVPQVPGEPQGERMTEVPAMPSGPGPAVSVPRHEPPRVAATHLDTLPGHPSRRGLGVALVAGIVLVIAGIAVAGIALYMHLSEREHGHRHRTPDWASDAGIVDAGGE